MEFSVPPQNPYFWQIISSVLPVLLIFGLLYFLFMRQIRSAGHGALSFGKSRARMLNRDTNKITFENVAGIDEAKEEVQEIIEFLKDPKRFQKLGGRIPKGVLLMGPPGTGKTLLAKAIAGEADVPFFSISGSDFVEMFVGVGASRVRDMFEQGKKNAPCIIFIDEIDAVGRSRFTGIGGGHDEREQTLNALLVRDGRVRDPGRRHHPGGHQPAGRARPGPAAARAASTGRSSSTCPTIDGREAILKMHAKKHQAGRAASTCAASRAARRFSGADLENLLNEAALLAARQDKEAVEMTDLEEARDKVKWGRERRSRVLDEKEKTHHGLPRGRPRAGACSWSRRASRCTRSRSSRAAWPTWAPPCSCRRRTATWRAATKLLGILAGLMGGRVAEELVLRRHHHRRQLRPEGGHAHRAPDGLQLGHERRRWARRPSARTRN